MIETISAISSDKYVELSLLMLLGGQLSGLGVEGYCRWQRKLRHNQNPREGVIIGLPRPLRQPTLPVIACWTGSGKILDRWWHVVSQLSRSLVVDDGTAQARHRYLSGREGDAQQLVVSVHKCSGLDMFAKTRTIELERVSTSSVHLASGELERERALQDLHKRIARY